MKNQEINSFLAEKSEKSGNKQSLAEKRRTKGCKKMYQKKSYILLSITQGDVFTGLVLK